MEKPVTAVIMLGAAGPSPVEHLVHEARRRATIVTVQALAALNQVAQIVMVAPEGERAWWQASAECLMPSANLVWDVEQAHQAFHFGNRLSGVVQRYALERALYIGGGSMPLLSCAKLGEVVMHLSRASERQAITNNLHSSDWLGLTHADTLPRLAHRLSRDNMLGWVLQEEEGFIVQALPPSAATRLDIDAPTDLAALRWHPDTPPLLSSYLARALSESDLARWKAAGRVLATPASHVALIGRVSSDVWRTLESQTQSWIRVYSEERGMTASGRQESGAVQSLLAQQIEQVGELAFFERLGRMVDAAFFDTRVYLAHHRSWGSAADRYASDLGRSEQISASRLRRLTEAALACRAPVVLGGYGVVSGGLYALVETLRAGADWLIGDN